MKLRSIQLDGNWSKLELDALAQALRALPRRLVESNKGLVGIGREPRLRNGPPDAPGHSLYDSQSGRIVVFDKGLYHRGKIDHEQFRRSIYHEICHAFLRDRPRLLQRWQSETRGDGFVDEYAKSSPAEDICDTFSEYLLHHDKVKKLVPRKSSFIEKLLNPETQEKTAMHLINAFADELQKTASPAATSMLKRLAALAKGRGGKAVAAGGLAGGGAALGHRSGKQSGYEEGTSDVGSVARRARMMGRKEGVMAYHRALMNRMGMGRKDRK